MWRDLGWGLVAAVALIFAGATIFYCLRVLSDLEGNDKKKLRETNQELYKYGSDYGQLETDGQHARTEYPYVSPTLRYPNKTDTAQDQDDVYDEPTEEPEETTSSPYLFQPIRYMNIPKDKRSFYREYKDG